MLRFRITSILFFVTSIAIGLAWYVDRTNLSGKLKTQQHPIAWYSEKHNLWSPSLHLHTDTDKLEAKLSGRIDTFDGDKIVSSQGMSQTELRRPTIGTLNAVIGLLDDSDEIVRQAAAELLALYLEAVSGRSSSDRNSIEIRAYFHAHAFSRVKELLKDPNPNIRAAGALAIGNVYYTRDAERLMRDVFDQETEQCVKMYLAWAHYQIAE